jgi:aryl-alcohol dehydrogenase-like predicted oxidoreductase
MITKIMASQNRRQFIGKSLTGLLGTASVFITWKAPTSEMPKKDRKLIYRTLGKTGLKIPVVSMGAAHTTNPNLIRAAMDEGIQLFATGEYYGPHEEMIGKIIKERGRDSAIILTSARPLGIDHKAGLFTGEESTEQYIKQMEGCMKRLGKDPIDIFMLPFVARRESVFHEPLLKAMDRIKKDGKAR